MNSRVYYHFQSIYGNSDEPIICTDENLGIVFATSAAYEIFGLAESPALHLNCVFMRKYLKALKAAFDKGECRSLNFESVNDGTDKKCIVMPCFFENEKYAVLVFYDISAQKLDNLRKYELKNAISASESAVVNSTSVIVSHMRLIKESRGHENSVNTVLQNVMIIRRLFRNLSLLAMPTVKNSLSHVIDVNEYLKYLTEVIIRQIGNSRLEFSLSLCQELSITEIEPKIFEILICNLVASSVKNAYGKAKISVQTALHENHVLIVFTDNGAGSKTLDRLFTSHSGSRVTDSADLAGPSASVIRKIVSDYGGRLFATENRDGGISVGFTLPKADKRRSAFHSPLTLEHDSREIFSTVNTELAEFIDPDKISI